MQKRADTKTGKITGKARHCKGYSPFFYVYAKVRIFAKKRTFLTLKITQARRGAAYRRVNSKKAVIFSQKCAHKTAPQPLPHKGLAGITTRKCAKNA
ncbi:hypothetical protein A3R75_003566 [Salmonella enterica subsp. diarizonae]|nr:hypothetical protein [Salmonella enterica subsp. diarizonae]